VSTSGEGESTGPGTPPSGRPSAIAGHRRLVWSTAIFSVATGVSRLLGLVREMVARNYFGVEGKINVFQVAYLVPSTVRALVADTALSGAFVPVFSELLETGDRSAPGVLPRASSG
jgi:putative peptidoglycan lipid II flippase